MTISIGPYQRNIPFVNIQDIRFDQSTQGEYNIVIGVSNEKVIPKRSVIKEYTFGNFIYFSSSKQEIDVLTSSKAELIETIKSNSKNQFLLKPRKSQFTIKSRSEKSNPIYSYLNRQQFTIPESKVVYVLVCSYIENKNNFIIGNVIKETLVTNNITPVDATIFTLKGTVETYGTKDTLWPGSAHIHNNQFMAGNAHTAIQHPDLVPTTALNVRLKDLRVIKAANSLDYRFIAEEKPYFSPITLSRGSSGDIHGSFTFDHLSFAKNNSKYGAFIKNNASVIAATEIKDLIIYQKISGRDADGNRLTPGKSQKCGLTEANYFKKVASLNDNCSIINNTNSNGSMVEVFFLDNTTREVISGAAEYKVEVILEDKTEDLINNVILPIEIELRKISGANMTEDSIFLFNTIVINYLTAVQSIFGSDPFSTFSQRFWKKNLLSLVNKFNPQYDQDKSLFISTINNFISKIHNLLKSKKSKSSSFDINSMIFISRRNGNVVTTRNFDNKYIFTGTRDYGLDIIDSDVTITNTNIPSISYDSYNTRAQKEIQKFEIINTQAATLNPHGYLTAQFVNLTPNPLKIDTSRLGVPTRDALPIIQSKTQRRSVLDINKQQSPTSRKSEILNALNVSVVKNSIPLKNLIRQPRGMAIDILDSANFLSKTSDFIYENKSLEATSGSTISTIVSTPSVDILGSLLVDDIIDKSVTDYNFVSTLTHTSELSGSPAQHKFNEDSSVIASGSAFSNVVDFNSIAQVQYLDSYDIKQGVRKQNWKLLTTQKVEDSKKNSKPLVCKLVKISSTLGSPDILDLKPMTSMFVIGEIQEKTLNSNIQQTIRQTRQQFEDLSINTDLDSVNILYAKNIPFISLDISIDSTRSRTISRSSTMEQLFTLAPSTLGY